MIEVAVYDTKHYDREYLSRTNQKINWRFLDFRLNAETALTAKGSIAVCVFVNDQLDGDCLKCLAGHGVKLVALRCAGYNNIDLGAAKKLGLQVVRVPAYSPHAVAEHAVGLLLTLNRKIHRAYNRVREHNFSLNGLVGFDLFNKTVGILGTGKIGKIAAQIFRGFQCNVFVHDPIPDFEWAKQNQIEYADFKTLLSSCDILTLHLPLTPETFHLLNAESLAKMKRGAFLINTSRGKLIDSCALIEALKRGDLGGVALDVYEEEEGIFFEDLSNQVLLDDDLSHLLTFPNVLITSHQAFLTEEALSEIGRVTSENIRRFSSGEPFLSGTTLP